MEKEKRKSTWKRDSSIIIILIMSFSTFTCGAWCLDSWFGWGNELGYFADFETEEDVEAFLLEHLEVGVTTHNEALSWMHQYDTEDSCHDPFYPPKDNYFECKSTIFASMRQGGRAYYWMQFVFNQDTTLRGIAVMRICNCFPD